MMAGRPLVLCYHAISDDWPSVLAISPKRLEEQLRYLLEEGYQPVTFDEALNGSSDRRTLAVTFDDGYRSVADRAFPVMQELGVPGTIFVPTAFMGSERPMSWSGIAQWLGSPHEDELIGMSWRELETLAQAGWEIGSHTRSHPKLTTLDDDALAEESTESREAIRSRFGACNAIAFPYGDHDRRVERAARDAGYEAGAGLRPGMTTRWCWPRVGVYPADDDRRFRLKTNPAVRRVRGSRVGGILEQVRQVRRAS